jgi:hypothetical protein
MIGGGVLAWILTTLEVRGLGVVSVSTEVAVSHQESYNAQCFLRGISNVLGGQGACVELAHLYNACSYAILVPRIDKGSIGLYGQLDVWQRLHVGQTDTISKSDPWHQRINKAGRYAYH